MAGHHFRFCVVNTFKSHYGMKKNGGLRNFCFAEILFRTIEHNIRDPEPNNFIGLFKKLFANALFS